MIHNLMVLTKSGITIYYKQYSPDSFIKNQVMVSAFFSAMFSFSNNLTGKALDLLRMGNRQFLVKESPDLLFIALIDSDDDLNETNGRLDYLKDFFYKNYKKYIDKKTFDGNLERFVTIEDKIDNYLERNPIPKNTSGDIVGTLEEIKKLVNTRKKGTKDKLRKLLEEKIKEAKTS